MTDSTDTTTDGILPRTFRSLGIFAAVLAGGLLVTTVCAGIAGLAGDSSGPMVGLAASWCTALFGTVISSGTALVLAAGDWTSTLREAMQ